ncbi:MAG TPA: NADH-quinone oxidoreductase subunit M [Nitrospirales bacterium]|nr:NADH-quinone oxidoreductase subunit M [Nitrospirales bacterium]HIB54352.1 NADH-quinone oxidoreductase subunit M [Nitrospirales bacterium]HIN33242.1 NADH-quinone oxidoreductase subunit M [Nitrospirales bacterium]HIO22027.1 NADH-quinone oxidoreductase subunit M [Nitrospirales bacterium]
MPFLSEHLLSVIVFIPVIGMGIIAFIRDQAIVLRVSLGVTVLNFLVSLYLWNAFDPSIHGMQFVERVEWMRTFNIHYAVGIDGISLLLVILTTLLTPLCVLCSWNNLDRSPKAFMMLILLMEAAMLVVFMATDTFLFFMAWEITMIPMYFMIALWGGPGRIAASLKFILYSLIGSLLLLVAILGLYIVGGHTFDLMELTGQTYSPTAQFWIFLAFFLAFAIKMPMVPFHTWLPDAHSEAPTAGSVILAGVLLKLGGYGFLRFCLPILPEASLTFTPLILWLSILAILYGGYMALAQIDLKKLIAYSSISHMGFVTLGIFAWNSQGVHGAVLQMFNHGITTGALFLIVGFLYDRTHSRMLNDYGGLHQPMPRYVIFLSIFSIASFGLPGTCNFIGEFLVLVGTSFQSFPMVLLAMGGIVLAAGYMLWMVQRVALGPVTTPRNARLADITPREMTILVPLVVIVFWVGLYPGPLLETIDASVIGIVEHGNGVQPLQWSQVFEGRVP